MKRLSNIFQFLIGFALGLAILAGGTAALAYVFFAKMTANPPKPIFTEEKQEKNANKQSTTSATTAEAPASESTPEEQEKPEEENLPTGAYKARVTWADGLSIRSNPDREAERIGGVGYNSEIIVLEESNDKLWQKVRLSGGSLEGWIKSGNVEKIEE
jgi:hypothetical protein